jgi:hypothetical protein
VILLTPKTPPLHPLIDLRCSSCTDVDWPVADLVIADPPWMYVRLSCVYSCSVRTRPRRNLLIER